MFIYAFVIASALAAGVGNDGGVGNGGGGSTSGRRSAHADGVTHNNTFAREGSGMRGSFARDSRAPTDGGGGNGH